MQRQWWQGKTAYQIYPKSFCDSNGDGIGDIPGIISKLDELQELGVEILWLSPVYCSPMADQGYDISDYYNIDPRFGTMEDMDRLIAEGKKRGMSIVMDLVVNHCSDEHEWFRKACEDPDGPYGQYFYIRPWHEGEKLPNNWRSYFGGSVWEKLPGHDDRIYLHLFHKKPELGKPRPARGNLQNGQLVAGQGRGGLPHRRDHQYQEAHPADGELFRRPPGWPVFRPSDAAGRGGSDGYAQ